MSGFALAAEAGKAVTSSLSEFFVLILLFYFIASGDSIFSLILFSALSSASEGIVLSLSLAACARSRFLHQEETSPPSPSDKRRAETDRQERVEGRSNLLFFSFFGV